MVYQCLTSAPNEATKRPEGEVSHLLMLQRVNILNKTTALEGVFGLEMMRIADGKGENSPKADRAVIGFTCVCHVVLLG